MASSYLAFQVNCCQQKSSISHHLHVFKTLSSSVKPFLGELQQLSSRIDVSKAIKNTSVKFLDAFVDHVFEFIDQPLLPIQSNFAPVDELRAAVLIKSIEGEIPDDVPEADGNKLLHKVDLKLNRCSLWHEIGVTQRYNVFLDYPLSIDIKRLVLGGPLIKYENEGYAKIGIMPRYGDADSIKWFDVEPNCTFHILNCFEDGDEVVVWGCRALESIIPGPDLGLDKFEWFSRKFKPIEPVEESFDAITNDRLLFSRPYEWRLNMQTGEVKERNLIGTEFSMDFPMINGDYTGLKNKYGYTQIVDSKASSASGLPKYGGLAKLYFEEPNTEISMREVQSEEPIKVEYHKFEEGVFCTGATFVSKGRGLEEDDGWIITFVHNENTNTSEVYIIDTKKFSGEPIAKITLPCRVPYGFHGAFMSTPLHIFEAL
ncbi:hypothetical protein LWI29_027734 [Acer saccharum]|uniref:Uncharacterized protein n=1 Tax=Acer saccharum TaxID=4024 RepID=A0AA39VAC5_ACESA|nr:hypothetical protein LWI29_027734 [Acer saccharum]